MKRIPIPLIVKHCAMAIYRDRPAGTQKQRFLEALAIATSRLTEYGFVVKGSATKDATQARLTAKGRLGEAKHRRENSAKQDHFDILYEKFIVKPKPDVERKP